MLPIWHFLVSLKRGNAAKGKTQNADIQALTKRAAFLASIVAMRYYPCLLNMPGFSVLAIR
jgi:hypothetical protein